MRHSASSRCGGTSMQRCALAKGSAADDLIAAADALQSIFRSTQPLFMKPRSVWVNWPMLGNTYGMSASETPNHLASVAPYCAVDVEGIHRPRSLDPVSESSSPPSARLG